MSPRTYKPGELVYVPAVHNGHQIAQLVRRRRGRVVRGVHPPSSWWVRRWNAARRAWSRKMMVEDREIFGRVPPEIARQLDQPALFSGKVEQPSLFAEA